MTTIPLTVTAKNEQAAIGRCLDSLLAAKRHAEARLPIELDVLVVLDDCTDGTAAVVEAASVRVVTSTGGKVEAQRRGHRPGPFEVFSDADLVVAQDTLTALCRVMLEQPEVAVAYPPKYPLPPRRRTPLAWALHVYNRRGGFSSRQQWFSGKLFAIRGWSAPGAAELAARARPLPPSRFYDWAAPLTVDDVWLSRRVQGAIRKTGAGAISYRAPETFQGMYRYYRRMRRELERTDALFPETVAARRSPDLLPTAPASERAAHAVFQAALTGCRLAYRAERLWVDALGGSFDAWPPVSETKRL